MKQSELVTIGWAYGASDAYLARSMLATLALARLRSNCLSVDGPAATIERLHPFRAPAVAADIRTTAKTRLTTCCRGDV